MTTKTVCLEISGPTTTIIRNIFLFIQKKLKNFFSCRSNGQNIDDQKYENSAFCGIISWVRNLRRFSLYYRFLRDTVALIIIVSMVEVEKHLREKRNRKQSEYYSD